MISSTPSQPPTNTQFVQRPPETVQSFHAITLKVLSNSPCNMTDNQTPEAVQATRPHPCLPDPLTVASNRQTAGQATPSSHWQGVNMCFRCSHRLAKQPVRVDAAGQLGWLNPVCTLHDAHPMRGPARAGSDLGLLFETWPFNDQHVNGQVHPPVPHTTPPLPRPHPQHGPCSCTLPSPMAHTTSTCWLPMAQQAHHTAIDCTAHACNLLVALLSQQEVRVTDGPTRPSVRTACHCLLRTARLCPPHTTPNEHTKQCLSSCHSPQPSCATQLKMTGDQ